MEAPITPPRVAWVNDDPPTPATAARWPSNADEHAELSFRGAEKLGFGKGADRDMTWNQAWAVQDRGRAWQVKWAMAQARDGSARREVTDFAAWCELMQELEAKLSDDARLALHVTCKRPRCPTHAPCRAGD